MARTLKIDLFTDTVCPWCLIGATRLDQAVAKLPADVTVDIENHPFYLDPTTPPEGYDVGEMLRTKYGREPQEIWARAEAGRGNRASTSTCRSSRAPIARRKTTR